MKDRRSEFVKKREAFTLIELVSVLVILAILALIVTPLVLNIIIKARTAADKRSIDAYGRSIELAIADYLLENGTFPISIEELTIEYSGDRVVCQTVGLRPDDTSVYLAECTVNGRIVEGYTYGKSSEEEKSYDYKVGTIITYNNVNYYVLKDSKKSDLTVTLLKAEPLTVEEVSTYGHGHVNMYITSDEESDLYHKPYNLNGYGGMAYYSSATCGGGTYDGCKTDYELSEVKYVVDVWKTAQAPKAREARLITKEEIEESYIEEVRVGVSDEYTVLIPQYDWLYDNNYWYWTMTPYEDSLYNVWYVNSSGSLSSANSIVNSGNGGDGHGGMVRPVITISKSVL